MGIIIQVIISFCISIILFNESKNMVNNDVNIGIVKYSSKNCLIFIGLGIIVGLISITFGLAGGFMANPFLLMIGFDPLVCLKLIFRCLLQLQQGSWRSLLQVVYLNSS